MRTEESKIDMQLLEYLHKYGNTRESDLIEYGIGVSGQTGEEIKKLLDKMTIQGWTERVVHDKLDKNIIYIAKGNWPLDLSLSVEADALGIKDKEKIMEDAKKILEEAEIVAEKRIREKYPEMFKDSK